jgi:general secretion pathway protein J
LFGAFHVLYSSSIELGSGTLQFEMGQQCISRITADIESAYVSQAPFYKQPELRDTTDPYRMEGSLENADGKTFSRMRFNSLSHFSFSGGESEGVAEIVYYVNYRNDEDGYVLRRSDSLYPYEEFEEKNTDPIICKHLQTFSITFYDEDGEEYEEWDSESSEYEYASPNSVQVHLSIGDEASPMVFSTRILIPAYREKLESSA